MEITTIGIDIAKRIFRVPRSVNRLVVERTALEMPT